jgi:methionyl-tRNA formyltransferase
MVKTCLLTTQGSLVGEVLLHHLAIAGVSVDLIVEEVGKRAEYESKYLRPFNQFALQYPAFHENLKTEHTISNEVLNAMKKLSPAWVIVDGSIMIPDEYLGAKGLCFIHAHPGILPDFAGVDCVKWAILEGRKIGSSVHILTSKLDAGPVLAQAELKNSKYSNILDIRQDVLCLGAQLISQVVSKMSPPSGPFATNSSIKLRKRMKPHEHDAVIEIIKCRRTSLEH